MGLVNKNISVIIPKVKNNIPEKIKWTAKEGGVDAASAKALILSLWDDKDATAMRIDLWNIKCKNDKIMIRPTLPFIQLKISCL